MSSHFYMGEIKPVLEIRLYTVISIRPFLIYNFTCNMCHVSHEVRSTGVSDFAESCVVEVARVARNSGDDQFWLEQLRRLLQLVVIDQTGFRIDLKSEYLISKAKSDQYV